MLDANEISLDNPTRNNSDLRAFAIEARVAVLEARQERVETLFLEQEIAMRAVEKLLGEFHVKLMRIDPPKPTD